MAWFPCNLNSNLGGKAKLLWTNPSPSSAFSAQTVSLDLSQYDSILIELLIDTANQKVTSKTLIKIGDSNIACGRSNSSTDTGAARIVTSVTKNSIVFGNCLLNSAVNNGCGIPYKIYGAKLTFE